MLPVFVGEQRAQVRPEKRRDYRLKYSQSAGFFQALPNCGRCAAFRQEYLAVENKFTSCGFLFIHKIRCGQYYPRVAKIQ